MANNNNLSLKKTCGYSELLETHFDKMADRDMKELAKSVINGALDLSDSIRIEANTQWIKLMMPEYTFGIGPMVNGFNLAFRSRNIDLGNLSQYRSKRGEGEEWVYVRIKPDVKIALNDIMEIVKKVNKMPSDIEKVVIEESAGIIKDDALESADGEVNEKEKNVEEPMKEAIGSFAGDMSDFYASVVSCPNSNEICPGIVKDVKRGCPPRGFYTQGAPGDISIMIVGKNPGHVLDNERVLYLGQTPKGIVKIQSDFIGSIFKSTYQGNSGDNRSLRFQKNLLRYLSFFLDIPAKDVFKKCALTNMVKCSTVGEQDRLNNRTLSQCFQKHLIREIEFFKPKVILALGREVEKFLKSQGVEQPVIYIKHPSYFYRKDIEQDELDGIKSWMQKYI